MIFNDITGLDGLVFAVYILALLGLSWFVSRRSQTSGDDFFLAGRGMNLWVVAVSVLATSQSAATFLGGPDQGFRGNLTYLSSNIGAVIAALFVSTYLIPAFYRRGVSTVYQLLSDDIGVKSEKAAGLMYFIGRVFASGARLYMAALAVSMLLFADVAASSVIISSGLLTIAAFALTYRGGIRSVIWSDGLQCLVYVSAAIGVIIWLLYQIPADGSQVIEVLSGGADGPDKLQLFDASWDISKPYTIWAALTGFVLLNIGAFGLDQDMTQRLLTCKDQKDGQKALYLSIFLIIPVMLAFMIIGLLLHIFYQQPELMQGYSAAVGLSGGAEFAGEKITVFMHYILTELPPGLKGLVVVGVVAAALSTLNSGLNSMSSVLVKDLWPGQIISEVKAGRAGMLAVGLLLFAMSALCYYWQRYSDMPLLDFALSVMVFSYSGLLGVYFTVLFTKRGSDASVIAALITGFIVTLAQQPWLVDFSGLPGVMKTLAFPWKLCIGTLAALLVCLVGSRRGKA